jgi:recombination protein RecA
MEWQQGLQARLLNKMSRKAQASRTAVRSDFARPITEIWVNQEREKIGVCFDYKTLITLADGSCEKIGKIVNGRIPVDVLTMSPDGCVVPRRVVQWHKGKYSGDGLYVSMGGGIGKPHGVRVTSNHMFFTPGGTVRASELKPGDIVLSCERKFFSPDQHQVILGSVLGDGSLRFERGYRGHLRVWHGKDQREYCSWKAGILGSEMHDGKRACWFETARSVEFAPYADISKCKSVRSISDSLIEQIGPLALAIWFMDDGTFEGKNRTRKWGHGRYSIFAKTLSVEILNRIAGQLEAIGAGKAHVSRGRLTWTGGRESAEFARTIAPFIHASMAYKIRHGTEIGNGSISVGIPGWCIYPNRIVAVRPVRGRGNARDCWSTGMRFDIGVDGNHNYFAGGMLVHNSYGDNTVIPGGRGQQFTASVIVKLWASQWERATVDEDMKKEWQMEGGTDVRLNFKVIKNKTARAMVQGSYRMGVSGDGAGLVLDLDYMAAQAEKFGLMRKDGAKWLLGDETYKTKGDLMARMEEAAVRRALRDRLVQLMLAAA